MGGRIGRLLELWWMTYRVGRAASPSREHVRHRDEMRSGAESLGRWRTAVVMECMRNTSTTARKGWTKVCGGRRGGDQRAAVGAIIAKLKWD